MSRTSRQRQRLTLLAVAVAVAVAIWLTRGRFDWARIIYAFRDLDPPWLASSIVLCLLAYIIRTLRWSLLLRPMLDRSPVSVFSATIIGFTAVTLFGRPGELVRPYLVAQRNKLPFTSQMAIWTLERVSDLLAVLILFGYALIRVRESGAQATPGVLTIIEWGGRALAVGCAGGLAFMIAAIWYRSWVQSRLNGVLEALSSLGVKKASAVADAFLGGLEVVRSRRVLLGLGLTTLLEWAVIVLCFWCCLRAFPPTAAFGALDALLLVGVVSLGSIVQVPGIGGGMQVAAVVALTELFGIQVESATTMALLLWAVSFLLVVPLGLGLALTEGISLARLRELEEEAERQG